MHTQNAEGCRTTKPCNRTCVNFMAAATGNMALAVQELDSTRLRLICSLNPTSEPSAQAKPSTVPGATWIASSLKQYIERLAQPTKAKARAKPRGTQEHKLGELRTRVELSLAVPHLHNLAGAPRHRCFAFSCNCPVEG